MLSFAVLLMSMPASAQYLYWTDQNQDAIRYTNSFGTGPVVDLFDSTDGVDGPRGIAFDHGLELLYWTGGSFTNPTIRVGNLDGTGTPTLLFTDPDPNMSFRGIEVDRVNGKLYWAEDYYGGIYSGNTDGTGMTILFDGTDGVDSPTDVAIDVAGGKIYWTDPGNAAIVEANIDGSGTPTVLFDGGDGLASPASLELDLINQKIYWTDVANTTLEVGDLNGVGSPTILFSQADHIYVSYPSGLDIDVNTGEMYWVCHLFGVLSGSMSGSDLVNNSADINRLQFNGPMDTPEMIIYDSGVRAFVASPFAMPATNLWLLSVGILLIGLLSAIHIRRNGEASNEQ